MRNLIILVALAVLFFAACTGSNSKTSDSNTAKDTAVSMAGAIDTNGVVDIQDARQTPLPPQDAAGHKDHDIAVYRITHQRDGQSAQAYKVCFYRKENDTMRYYEATYGSADDYNKAAFKWLNDTAAHIRLFTPGSQKEISFDVFGRIKADGSKISGVSFPN